MTEEYRTTELEKAKAEAARIKPLMERAKVYGKRREWLDLAEEYEFWANKVSFLSHVKGEA